MDLLFTRYASPFILIDTLIQTESLSNYISDMFNFINEESQWEFFLHKIYNETWGEFKNRIKSEENAKRVNLGATVNKSSNMLTNFIPDEVE